MTIPQDAIEAAAQALSIHWKAPHTNEALGRQRALAEHALTAALPVLETAIRAKVADEIRAMYPEMSHQVLITERRYALYDGMREAARIAQGRE